MSSAPLHPDFEMSTPRPECIKLSIWIPFHSGHSSLTYSPGPMALATGGSEPGRQKCRLEVRQPGDKGRSRGVSLPHLLEVWAGMCCAKPGQNSSGPLGELSCLFTLKREGEKRQAEKVGAAEF